MDAGRTHEGPSKAEAVARYLLYLASKSKEPELITHMRLQKLLYYAQGWSLALREEPLFDETLEAWTHGPVAPSVYKVFKSYKEQSIPQEEARKDSPLLSEEDKAFIKSVWRRYRRYSALELRRRTHKEPPYRNARGDLPPDDWSNEPLSNEDMQRFFREEHEKHTRGWHGLSLDDFAKAERDLREGRVVSVEEAFQHLS